MTELKTLGFLGTAMLSLLYAPQAFGDSRPDLALQIARVSANEGALRYRVTTALVWQVVRQNGGNTLSKMASFLRRHSPRVHGQRVCRIGNCFWTPNLGRNDNKPAGLVLRNDFWHIRILPFWRDALSYADWLVSGQRKSDDPCSVQPQTWGGPMDRAGAIKRGLYPIGCRSMDACTTDSCNDGFTTYARCWENGAWVCDPSAEPRLKHPVADVLALNVQSAPAAR